MRGVLNINKPAGISSYDVIRRLKPVLRPRRIGHAGTLDPIASGVLLILLNEATKISRVLMELDKEYEAEITFGIETDTDDTTGRVIREAPVPEISAGELSRFLEENFSGEVWQVPPDYSALKQAGVPLYRRARAGMPVEKRPRRVRVYEITLSAWEPPVARIGVRVSSGTYVRALARDIGRALGSAATLSGLVRTRVGEFRLRDSLSLEEVQKTGAEIVHRLVPVEQALRHLPRLEVGPEIADQLLAGKRPVWHGALPADAGLLVAVSPERGFVALVRFRSGVLITERVVCAG